MTTKIPQIRFIESFLPEITNVMLRTFFISRKSVWLATYRARTRR